MFPLELANLTIFGGRFLGTGVVKHFEMKMLSCVIWVDLISITSAFDDGGRGRFDTGTRCHITTEAGVGVVHSQLRSCSHPSLHDLRWSSQKASRERFQMALLTPPFRDSGFLNCNI